MERFVYSRIQKYVVENLLEKQERDEKEMGKKIISPANANDKKLLDDKKNND